MADDLIFAVDISDDGIAGIVFSEGKKRAIIKAHWCLIGQNTGVTEALSEVVGRCEAAGMNCYASIGAGNFSFRSHRLPFADRKKVQSVLPFEIEDLAGFNDEPYVFDCLLDPDDTGGTNILAVLAKNEVIGKYLTLLKNHQLDPEIITVSGLPSALTGMRKLDGVPDDYSLLQIGFRRVNLFRVRRRAISTVRSFKMDSGDDDMITYSREQGTFAVTDPSRLSRELERVAGEVANTLLAWGTTDIEEHQRPLLAIEGPVMEQPGVSDLFCRVLAADKLDHSWPVSIEIDNQEALTAAGPVGVFINALALVCSLPKDRQQINFRKQEFARENAGAGMGRSLKIGAPIVAVLLAGLVGYLGYSYQTMKAERDQIAAQVEEIYRQTVPDATAVPDPVLALKAKVKEMHESSTTGAVHDPSLTFVKIFADISQRIPVTMKVTFERLIYDRTSIRVRGQTDTFNTVELMKNALEHSAYFREVTIGSANISPKDEGVLFELRLEL